MEPGTIDTNTEFLWRRLVEDCPDWVVALPVLFALAVVLLFALFRSERKLTGLLWGLGIVGVASVLYVPLALMFKPMFSWLVVLVPVVALALFYAGMMYRHDARSIHPAWASFLGLLRCTVYALLALVFLLPGCQTFDETVSHAKVVFLFDVSGSMKTQDDVPLQNQDPAKLPTRQDKIVRAFTAPTAGDKQPLLDRVLGKTQVAGYRFGPTLDETQILTLPQGTSYAAADLTRWLNPSKDDVVVPADVPEEKRAAVKQKLQDHLEALRTGTNLGGAALQAAKLENTSFVQAYVIVSDGQSNVGSDEPLKEFLQRVNASKHSIPVLTVGVGEFRQPAKIRIDDLQAPVLTPPDDKFPVRVPVVGEGLSDETFTVQLDLQRTKDATGQPVVEKPFTLPVVQGKFKGAGDNPQDTLDFDVDVQALTKIKAGGDKGADLEGTWLLTARVPRHPRETFAKPEHVSDPVEVQVQKKPLRVLLFAGGPTREYQFVRTLFYREVLEKRVEMTVYLQTGKEDNVDQDVESGRLLAHFPDKLGPDDGSHLSLSEYDVVVAFDPDWTLLTPAQMGLLKEWVGNQSGGLIFVAGPVFAYHLATPAGRDLNALLTLIPVVLKDSRLHGLGLPNSGLNHDASRPYPLHFTPAAKQYGFLKLDETAEGPTAGWDEFFWGKGGPPAASAKDVRPKRGFYNYYPVERLKPDSQVIATFGGPEASRINDGKDEQPYLVSMRYGNGKSLYVGSGELWRLRQLKSGYHERLWIRMARYVSAGATQQKKYGRILMPRSVPTGTVAFEAQIKGANLLPIAKESRPSVTVRRVEDKETKAESFDLRAKPTDGDWQGWFMGSFKVREPGEYELKLPITGTSEYLSQRLTVRRPDPEADNVRTNFGLLYQMASEAAPLLARLTPEARKEVERVLQPPSVGNAPNEKEGGPRLFFTLNTADQLANCLTTLAPKRESVKGPLLDLWDRGVETGLSLNAFTLALVLPLLVGLLGAAILAFLKQYVAAGLFFAAGLLLALAVFVFNLLAGDLVWAELPLDLPFVLGAVVALLGIEWLTRKLLRLA